MERRSHFTSEFSGSANTTRRHVTIAYAFLSVDLLDRKHRLPGLAAPAREPFWGFGRFRSTDMAFPQVATAVYEESSQDHRLFAPDSRFSASGFAKTPVRANLMQEFGVRPAYHHASKPFKACA